MDISNLANNVANVGSVAPVVTKSVGGSAASQSPATVGNFLPDAGQARVQGEDSSATNPTVANPVPPPSSEELNNLVDQANVTLQGRSSDLKFTIAEGTDISVVRIEDAKTGELIRQFPSEEMVAVARVLREAQQGMMFEEKA